MTYINGNLNCRSLEFCFVACRVVRGTNQTACSVWVPRKRLQADETGTRGAITARLHRRQFPLALAASDADLRLGSSVLAKRSEPEIIKSWHKPAQLLL